MTPFQRYAGEELSPSPHIIVLGSCKVGNFVVSTPALSGLRQRFPDAIQEVCNGSQLCCYFCHEVHDLDDLLLEVF